MSSSASAGSFSFSGLGFQKLFQSGVSGSTLMGQRGDISLIISSLALSLAFLWNYCYLDIRCLRTDPLVSLPLSILCLFILLSGRDP